MSQNNNNNSGIWSAPQRIFRCIWPNCEYSFAKRDAAAEHIRNAELHQYKLGPGAEAAKANIVALIEAHQKKKELEKRMKWEAENRGSMELFEVEQEIKDGRFVEPEGPFLDCPAADCNIKCNGQVHLDRHVNSVHPNLNIEDDLEAYSWARPEKVVCRRTIMYGVQTLKRKMEHVPKRACLSCRREMRKERKKFLLRKKMREEKAKLTAALASADISNDN